MDQPGNTEIDIDFDAEEYEELTNLDPANSEYEFDPYYEYDTVQYFDFLNTKALYGPFEECEYWISGEEWFNQENLEGHEPDYPSVLVRLIEDEIIELETSYDSNCSESELRTPVKSSQSKFTPYRSPTSSISSTSPKSPVYSYQSATPASVKKLRTLSSVTTNVNSPLKGGAQRVLVASSSNETLLSSPSSNSKALRQKTSMSPTSKAITCTSGTKTILSGPNRVSPASTKPSAATQSVVPKSSGAQRVAITSPLSGLQPEQEEAVEVVTPRHLGSNSPSRTPPNKDSQHPALTSKPSSKTLTVQSTTSVVKSSGQAETKALTQQASDPVKETVMPRYLDTKQPVHRSQVPPRALARAQSKENIPYKGTRITKRGPTKPRAGTGQSTTSSVQIPRKPLSNRSSVTLDEDLAALLAEHNKKFKPKPVYEPRKFGIKEIREWEARRGLRWYELNPEQRQEANEEMEQMRRNTAIDAQ